MGGGLEWLEYGVVEIRSCCLLMLWWWVVSELASFAMLIMFSDLWEGMNVGQKCQTTQTWEGEGYGMAGGCSC